MRCPERALTRHWVLLLLRTVLFGVWRLRCLARLCSIFLWLTPKKKAQALLMFRHFSKASCSTGTPELWYPWAYRRSVRSAQSCLCSHALLKRGMVGLGRWRSRSPVCHARMRTRVQTPKGKCDGPCVSSQCPYSGMESRKRIPRHLWVARWHTQL